MTIFTKVIIPYVLLPLLFLQFLPYVTCQQEPESEDPGKVTVGSVLGIFLLATFLSCMIAGCCFYTVRGFQIEAPGGHHEVVLQSRARRGLEKDVIESFPSFLYSEVKELKIGKGGVECAICLNEFENEERLRWMPPCSHTFHADCVDVWLSSQSTCPVCRAKLSMYPGQYPWTDLESGNAQGGGLNPLDDISLLGNNNNVNCTTPRSRSTGFLSNWRIAGILLFPRSSSTGHSMVQVGENLDRFTLQLPEEVQRQLVNMNLMRQRRHVALPRASSSRQGYRERINLSKGRETLRRAMSVSFSFQAGSVRSTHGEDDLVRSQAMDKGFGERSFERLMPEKPMSLA